MPEKEMENKSASHLELLLRKKGEKLADSFKSLGRGLWKTSEKVADNPDDSPSMSLGNLFLGIGLIVGASTLITSAITGTYASDASVRDYAEMAGFFVGFGGVIKASAHFGRYMRVKYRHVDLTTKA